MEEERKLTGKTWHELSLPAQDRTGWRRFIDAFNFTLFYDQRRLDIIDQVESTTVYTVTPCGGSFTSPGIDTR